MLGKSVVVWWRTLGLMPTLRALAPEHLQRLMTVTPARMLASRGAACAASS